MVYKFTCAECNSVYTGETSRQLSTRVREHLFSDKTSYVYTHLRSSSACKEALDEKCFAVLDSANTAYKLKIKEALHIMWEGPNLHIFSSRCLLFRSFFVIFILFFYLYIPIRLIGCTIYQYVL